MKYALWIVQVLLAFMFAGTGMTKILTPYEELIANPQMAWAEGFAPWMVIAIGVVEILAVLGLILPALTRILPILTPLAALGLVLDMVGAMITHMVRGEWNVVPLPLVLLILAAFVAYGRFRIRPIPARGAA